MGLMFQVDPMGFMDRPGRICRCCWQCSTWQTNDYVNHARRPTVAGAGDRLQIVIGAKDELSASCGTRKELTTLGRTANDIQRRMENGEQGTPERTGADAREIGPVTAEHKDLSHCKRSPRSTAEFREMTTNSRRGRPDDPVDGPCRSGDGDHRRQAKRLERTTGRMKSGWAKSSASPPR